MPRVAFITDQHFEASGRWDETLRIAQWCVDTLRELQPDAIALGGDMFEKRPTPLEVKAVAEWLVQLGNIAPVVGVYGNHDVPESLAPMNLLESRWPIRIADVPETVFAGGVEFALLPWPRKAHLLAALGDVGREEASAAATHALQSVLRGMGASERRPRCFVGHVQLAGARVSTGQPLAPGADFELGLGDLALCRADAYLLGHIHLPQDSGVIDGSPVLYGGSFRRTSFGELEEKSLVVVEFDGQTTLVKRIPIPCRRMVHVDAVWTGTALSTGHIKRYADSEIRLRFECPKDFREQARAQAEAIRDELLEAGAHSVKLEERTIIETRSRAPEVAQAKTLPERLDAFWSSKSIDVGDRRQSILEKLNQIETEARDHAA